MGLGEPLFGIFIGVRPENLEVAKYLYWIDSTHCYWTRCIVIGLTPFYCLVLLYLSNFLQHSFGNMSISDDGGDCDDDDDYDDEGGGDDDDDDYSIHPKPLFPAPHAAGRNHHLSDFCQNIRLLIIILIILNSHNHSFHTHHTQ